MKDKFAVILREEFVPNRDPHHGTGLEGMTETQIRQSKRTCILATIQTRCLPTVAYPGILFGRGGGSTNSVEDRGQRERGSGGGRPLVRGSGGSCNLVQEVSFHIVKFS